MMLTKMEATRKKRGQTNLTVYGILSTGEQFSFYELNQKGHVAAQFLHVDQDGWEKVANALASIILAGMKIWSSPVRASVASVPIA